VFYAELNELLTRELAEDGYSGVEVRVTPLRTEIIIRATRTTNVLGEPRPPGLRPRIHRAQARQGAAGPPGCEQQRQQRQEPGAERPIAGRRPSRAALARKRPRHRSSSWPSCSGVSRSQEPSGRPKPQGPSARLHRQQCARTPARSAKAQRLGVPRICVKAHHGAASAS
jgi:hypothetical protein